MSNRRKRYVAPERTDPLRYENPELFEACGKLPIKLRDRIRALKKFGFSPSFLASVMHPYTPLGKKLKEDHVKKVLEFSEEEA